MGTAFLAGVLTFLSPCTLPLVPGFLAFLGGGRSGMPQEGSNRVVANATRFAIGFALAYGLIGGLAGSFGAFFSHYRLEVTIFSGLLFTLYGAWLLVSHEKAWPTWSTPLEWLTSRVGFVLLGLVFALSWTPCIGPTLATALYLAASTGTALKGMFLLLTFMAGVAVCFVIVAGLFRVAGKRIRYRPLFGTLQALLVLAVGLVLLTNHLALLSGWAVSGLAYLHYGTNLPLL